MARELGLENEIYWCRNIFYSIYCGNWVIDSKFLLTCFILSSCNLSGGGIYSLLAHDPVPCPVQ